MISYLFISFSLFAEENTNLSKKGIHWKSNYKILECVQLFLFTFLLFNTLFSVHSPVLNPSQRFHDADVIIHMTARGQYADCSWLQRSWRMRFFLVVHSLIILLHQHNAGEYLAIRKIQKLCFYDSRLKYTKIWNENILEGALPQKTGSDFSGSVHNNYSDHSFPPLSSSCPHPPPFLPPPRDWNRRMFKLEQMYLPVVTIVLFFVFFQ